MKNQEISHALGVTTFPQFCIFNRDFQRAELSEFISVCNYMKEVIEMNLPARRASRRRGRAKELPGTAHSPQRAKLGQSSRS